MPYSAFTTSLLACKIPDQLASVLGMPSYQHLARLAYPSPKYQVFAISKKSGGQRLIYSPSAKLKTVQRKLSAAFQELDNSRPSVHGFRRGRSVVSNAKPHERKAYVLNVDLEDFFPSINFGRIYGLFQSHPFNFPPAVAAVLARLCTYKAFLPQGAPTSPALSNFVCRSLDGTLQKLAKDNFASYTRYADDLTFSFSRKKREKLPSALVGKNDHVSIGQDLQTAIQQHGFKVNSKKIRLRSRHSRMEVTGLTVNEFANVRRQYVDEIRGALNAWEKYGLANTQKTFATKPYQRQLRSGAQPPVQKVLRGKLLYLHMVKGISDPVYNRLARKFNNCVQNSIGCGVDPVPASNVALSEADLEKAVFVLSAEDLSNNFEIKSTCFFAEEFGLVTADHCLRYPPLNVDSDKKIMFPAALCGQYFSITPGTKLYLQDTLESNICELEIVWADKNADLAVIKPIGGVVVPHLNVALSESQVSGAQPVQLVGFPFHSPGKSISVAEGKIRSRYKRFGVLHFDVSPLIRTGNSGGPIISPAFRLLGVAIEGERQDGGNNAVVQLSELVGRHAHHKLSPWVP